ncbi:MAG TPA: 30S ribosomal protein S4e [candidate division Zixibacteria bacterium]|nr:30S ribosomal protein S4e [candidate division Zixibacteria bacterium]
MTKTGGSKHQKRIASPRNWTLPRKKHKFAFRVDPGPHSLDKSVPLGILMRDVLHLAETTREIKIILNKKLVKIDSRIITNPRYPVGLMDVIEIDELNKKYRILPHERHVMAPYEMKKGATLTKLCQIMNKTTIKGGITQLNLHDGRNILLPKEAGIEQKYNSKDSIEITLPAQKIVNHFPFKEGMYAIISDGRNVGKHGSIKEFQWRFGPRASTVTLVSTDGKEVQTTPEYIFVIGEKSPWFQTTGDET